MNGHTTTIFRINTLTAYRFKDVFLRETKWLRQTNFVEEIKYRRIQILYRNFSTFL